MKGIHCFFLLEQPTSKEIIVQLSVYKKDHYNDNRFSL